MKKLVLLIFTFLFLANPFKSIVYAVELPLCGLTVNPSVPGSNPILVEARDTIRSETPATANDMKFSVDISPIAGRGYPDLKIAFPDTACIYKTTTQSGTTLTTTLFNEVIQGSGKVFDPLCGYLLTLGYHDVTITSNDTPVCQTGGYTIQSNPTCNSISVLPEPPGIGDTYSEWRVDIKGIKKRVSWECPISDLPFVNKACAGTFSIIPEPIALKIFPVDQGNISTPKEWGLLPQYIFGDVSEVIGKNAFLIPPSLVGDKFISGTYEAQVLSKAPIFGGAGDILCRTQFPVGSPGVIPVPLPSWTPTPSPKPPPGPGEPSWTPAPAYKLPQLKPICDQIAPQYQLACKNCMSTPPYGGIWTAIGCLPIDLGLLFRDYIFVYGMGIAGGIAFLYFLYGAFIILTSMGNPERIEEGKQIIVSALSGIFLIIFSVFLIGIIGVDILQLPGFGK